MARIPTVIARESPLVGAPQSQASGEDFGAGIGRAMQGLGATITQVGGAFESVGAQRQADAERLAVASEVANSTWAVEYNETVDNYPDPSGAGLTGVTEEAYDTWMNKKLASTSLTGRAKNAYQLQLLQDKRLYLARAAEQQQTMGHNAAAVLSTTGLDTIINDVRSNGRTTIAEVDELYKRGDAVLRAQPGMDAVSLLDGQRKLASDLSAARFEALADSQKTELGIMGLQDELDDAAWSSRFTKEQYKATKAYIEAARNSIQVGTRAQITASLSTLSTRATAGVMSPPAEIAAAHALVMGAGASATPAMLADLHYIEFINEGLIATKGMSKAERDVYFSNRVSGTPGGGGGGVPADGGSGYKLTYVNQKSTRNRPVTRQLGSLYEQAARASGVTEVVIVSGGQPAKGEGGARTGSTRHDHGHAGDIQLKVNGRTLDMSNPDDLPIIAAFMRNAHALGATGIGAGTSYMGNRTFHVGYGTEAVWGAGGAGVNAPRWLVEATSGPRTGGSVVHPTLQAVGTKYNVPAVTLDGMWFAESTRGANTGTSRTGAMGPFQFTADTWARYGQGGDINNFEDAADAAGRYMADLLKQFHGNMTYALMAYNWGPGSVRAWIKEGSNPNAIPTETSDYVAKVMSAGGSGETGYTDGGGGGGGGGGGYTGGIGTVQPGTGPVAGYSYDDYLSMSLANQLDAAEAKGLNANPADYFAKQGTPLPTLTLESSQEDWAQYEKMFATDAAKHQLTPDQMQPLSTQALTAIGNVMASGDPAKRAAMYNGITSWSKEMSDAAFKQISETDKVAGYAGRMWSDNPQLATEAMSGRDAVNAMKEQGGLDWKNDADVYWRTNLNSVALRGLDPSIVDAMKGTTDAIMAYRMRTQGKEWDEDDYANIAAEVLGKKTEEFNGTTTVMPQDVEADELNNAFDAMTGNDWAMRSEAGAAPIDKNGQPLDGWQLAGASVFVIDSEDNYNVVIDGEKVMTINPQTGGAEAFVLHIEADWVDDINARTEAGVASTGSALNPDGTAVPILPVQQQTNIEALQENEAAAAAERQRAEEQILSGVPGTTIEPVATPAPIAAPEPAIASKPAVPTPTTPTAPDLPARTPTTDYPTDLRPQAIPPGGSVATRAAASQAIPPAGGVPPMVPQGGAPASSPTPPTRSRSREIQTQQRANEIMMTEYTKIVNNMRNLSKKQKRDMIEKYRRELPKAE